MDAPTLCPCGRPLHYADPKARAQIERFIAEQGEMIVVTIAGGRKFMVPRHYIALHGLRAAELPALAEKHGFEEV